MSGVVPAGGWLEVLAVACRERTQVRVAQLVGYSPATISQVLSGTYRGDMAAIESAVKGALMGGTVRCPVLDVIPTNQCMEHQRRPRSHANPLRVRLWRACRGGCPHSRLSREEVGDVVE